MKCLVLAGGLGSRLGKARSAKPLTVVGGLSLVERSIAAAQRAGADAFVVVCGAGVPGREAPRNPRVSVFCRAAKLLHGTAATAVAKIRSVPGLGFSRAFVERRACLVTITVSGVVLAGDR